jgi:glutathione synthase/RimK-type ligase-like ATP-grasp enzyme
MQLTILTPAPTHNDRYDDWREQAALLDPLFAPLDIHPHYRPWTDDAPLDCDLVLPLMAWGYHRDIARWYAHLDRWQQEGARFANPLSVLRWNTDKRYLIDFDAKHIEVVPTRYRDSLTATDIAQARADFGAQVVIKPPVSAGSDDTWLLRDGVDVPLAALGRAMLIQPMMPDIATSGELSLFYLGGTLAHAIVKHPKAGDFRVQPQFGGSNAAIDPPPGAMALAEQALAAAGDGIVYARVDMVGNGAGGYALMEIELIEPWLYLHRAADGGAAFARAVAAIR